MLTIGEMWAAYEVAVHGGQLPSNAVIRHRLERWQQRRAFYQGVYMALQSLAAQQIARPESPVSLQALFDEFERFMAEMKVGKA
jgi:hypothetical protein